ncbi:MAG: hypothetical protein COV76_07095 [Candidatus Omnitrophica bacterium CG11_big_fil_rev_8_21_14_0_20_64_10]|nr:MAG: hypothetical protein COV76_07095 [Candidatus Omnitrophica bacterium CG11_big_fil_rev_8_21_14_0_20_64_10]
MRGARTGLLAVCLSAVLLGWAAPPAAALEIPEKPRGYVHDGAGLLSPEVRSRLEAALLRYDRQTSNQIAVAIFPSLEEESLEDFSIRLAEAWKVGQAGRDNGVVLLIFQQERLIRIEVGYGLEGALTDAESGLIIHEVIAPRFRQEDYEKGVLAGVSAISEAIQGEFQAAEKPPSGSRRAVRGRELTPQELARLKREGMVFGGIVGLLLLGLCIVDLLRYRSYRSGHRLYRDRYSFWEWFFRFALVLAVLSMVFRVLFYMMLFSRGGGAGGRGGGFGGGAFGGGGASGRW